MPNGTATPRRVLFIVSEFAPMVSIGRLRVQMFCRYLPAFNWQPTVLTFDPRDIWHTDDTLLEEIPPAATVSRVRWIHPFDLPFRLLGKLRRADRSAAQVLSAAQASRLCPPGGQAAAPPSGPRWTSRLMAVKVWLERHLLIPDEAITGVLPMLLRAVQLHRRQPFDAVVVSMPAYSTWLAGVLLKKIFNIPVIVDYRDLWHGDVLRQWVSPWRSRLELALERRALSQTDAVSVATMRYMQYLRALDPAPDQRLYRTIYSGFDPTLIPDSPGDETGSRTLEMLCVGKLYKQRRADELVRALGNLKAADRLSVSDWRLTFLGHVASDQQRRLDAIIDQYALAGHIRFERFVSRPEALRRERRAGALVLIVDTGPLSDGTVPGKVFEYLALGRRILAVCPPGETDRLCRNAGHTLIARPDDLRGIEETVAALFSQVASGPDVGVPPAARRLPYVADRQTALLADLLDRTCAGLSNRACAAALRTVQEQAEPA